MATSTGIAPTRNSHCQSRCSTITPLITSPIPPPTPKTELTVPIPTPIRSGGNSSRMIPNESGKTAPPTPWIARKKISEGRSQAAAAPSEARPKIAIAITSSLSLPYWSPSLPRIGVRTEEVSSRMVAIQVTQAVLVSNSRWNSGSAGITSVCMNANETPAVVSSASVTR